MVESGAEGRRLAVRLDLDEGWHVNANQPLQDDLIPTELALGSAIDDVDLRDLRYPPAETVTLGFQAAPLAVYQGGIVITGTLAGVAATAPVRVPLRLTVQACDDRLCLAPEVLTLEVPVW